MPKGTETHEQEEIQMTRQELNHIIETKAAAYGFGIKREGERITEVTGTQESYISIRIFERPDFEKSDLENRIGVSDIEIRTSICRMGGEPTMDELIEAADEIERGAKLTNDLRSQHLAIEEKF